MLRLLPTGMQLGLYANVEQDGVTMMDAIVSDLRRWMHLSVFLPK